MNGSLPAWACELPAAPPGSSARVPLDRPPAIASVAKSQPAPKRLASWPPSDSALAPSPSLAPASPELCSAARAAWNASRREARAALADARDRARREDVRRGAALDEQQIRAQPGRNAAAVAPAEVGGAGNERVSVASAERPSTGRPRVRRLDQDRQRGSSSVGRPPQPYALQSS